MAVKRMMMMKMMTMIRIIMFNENVNIERILDSISGNNDDRGVVYGMTVM